MDSLLSIKTEWYINHKNIKIINAENHSCDLCFIFCSSNGIYNKKNEQECIDYIINDKYEWENISKSLRKKASKFIFLRDIFLRDYVEGVNKEINSIDRIIEFIKKETVGLKVIVAGNSAGGYLSMIIGSMLDNVIRTFSWGGLFSLYSWTGSNNTFSFDDLVDLKKWDGTERSRYYKVAPLIKGGKAPIYHFYSSGNYSDNIQVNEINESISNLFLFGFSSKIHGNTMNYFDIPFLLLSTENHINKIVSRFEGKNSISKTCFSIYNLGLLRFIFIEIKRAFYKIKRLIK